MKVLLIIAVFAILGYAGADCGCLKCSKHCTVVGEIPGHPGQLPIKVICRSEQGCPNAYGGYLPGPSQPITVQVPVPKPEVPPVCSGGARYSVQVKPFYKHLPGSCGCYSGCGAITGPLSAGNPCAYNCHTYPHQYFGPIVPVKVQVPAKPEVEKPCITIQGLKTNLDRVVIPCPGQGGHPWNLHVNHGVHHHSHGCPDSCHNSGGHNIGHHGIGHHGIGHHGIGHHGIGHHDIGHYGIGHHDIGHHGIGHHDIGHHGIGHHDIGHHGIGHRYESQNENPLFKALNFASPNSQNRVKRQILQHGYKFFVNMLPPFIQEPIKNVVNNMAITHPDVKIRKMYNIPPPPLTLKEKIEKKHKENVAVLKNKLYGTPIKNQATKNYETTKNKSYKPLKNQYKYSKVQIDEHVFEEEANHFIDSLQIPNVKQMKSFLRSRTQMKQQPSSWIDEKQSSEILGKHFYKKNKKNKMSQEEKAIFLKKLQKLNQSSAPKIRPKRSIIIGSDELDLPLYQIKIRGSDEDNEVNSDYDDDYDYEDDDERVGTRFNYDSREKFMRNVIREELRKFKRVQSDEEFVGDAANPYQQNKDTKFPLLHILTYPAKFLRKIKNTEDFPIMGAVPRMIIDTKNYFKHFGKNFKKNFLHLTSDMIGDFDNYGSNNNVLADILKRNRIVRSVDAPNVKNVLDSQNFRNISDAKVRKKRYILKTVDEDEIEELLREKLGKMFDEPRKSSKPRRKYKKQHKNHHGNSFESHKESHKKRQKKYSDESTEEYRKRKRPEKWKKKEQESSSEAKEKKIVIEPLRPKVIIDNNGLPFMEVDGYKRPLFLKKFKKEGRKSSDHSKEYESSEEYTMDSIHNVINSVKNRNSHSRNIEMPLETVKGKISELLQYIDTLVHMDFEKYDDVYDELIEIQSVKTSIVQSWKRIVMNKQINDYGAKIKILEKFEELQHLKTKTMHRIVYILRDDCENQFALKKITQALTALHKIQCIIDQVVSCFQEKFNTGTKFDLHKEMKFVDFLASLKFVPAKTRNDMITFLKDERDKELQESIMLLEKLKKLLVEGDEALIEEEANILWELKHVQKLQLSTIEEMCERLDEGHRIKKNLKALFDLERRLKELEERQQKMCSTESNKSEVDEVEGKSDEKKKKMSKLNLEEFKKKWQEKVQKQKELIEESHKKRMLKLKELKAHAKKQKSDEKTKSDEVKGGSDENEISDESISTTLEDDYD